MIVSSLQVFGPTEMPVRAILTTFLMVGPGYALPAFFAYSSKQEPAPLVIVACMLLYTWGSLINAAADFYKDGHKAAKPGSVVITGPFAIARHINWFGDWMR